MRGRRYGNRGGSLPGLSKCLTFKNFKLKKKKKSLKNVKRTHTHTPRSGSLLLLVPGAGSTPPPPCPMSVTPPPTPVWACRLYREEHPAKDTVSKQGEHDEIDSRPHARADPALGADAVVHDLVPVLTRQDLHRANDGQVRDLGWLRKRGQGKGEKSGPG